MNKVNKEMLIYPFLTIVILLLARYFYYEFKDNSQYFSGVGTLKTDNNVEVISSINSYMEINPADTHLDLELKKNYHCASVLYGYDNQYIYSWILCQAYRGSGQTLTIGYGFSSPLRAKYISPNFKITETIQPNDGSLYESTWKAMFPKVLYEKGSPNNTQSDLLEKEVRQKALN